MQRYAFIDVANTKETAAKVFGFNIDWGKLARFLTSEKWGCEKFFYYEGSVDNKKFQNLHKRLREMGYEVQTKLTFFQKNNEKPVKFICSGCNHENTVDSGVFKCNRCSEDALISLNNKGFHPKANFDVEIATDALSYGRDGVMILLFTGDGDFRYLAEELIKRGATVIFISTYGKTRDRKQKRFSTRLKELIAIEEERAVRLGSKSRVRFLEINNLKNLISK